MSNKLDYWEDKQNIEAIKSIANQVWGEKCEFGDMKVIKSPYPEFEWPIVLHGKIDVVLTYDRSILGINIMTDNGYENIRKFTEKEYIRGFESCKPKNLLHNFRILDEVVKAMMEKVEAPPSEEHDGGGNEEYMA
ncbi:MAG: hypothetical protein LBM18_00745 [Oscillospiraceae bacterium]|jgi:hypothetical protein|nr:hypothetical protein [Oscillospiraceae bacterium]